VDAQQRTRQTLLAQNIRDLGEYLPASDAMGAENHLLLLDSCATAHATAKANAVQAMRVVESAPRN